MRRRGLPSPALAADSPSTSVGTNAAAPNAGIVVLWVAAVGGKADHRWGLGDQTGGWRKRAERGAMAQQQHPAARDASER